MWLQKEKLARQDATLMSLERFQLPFSEKPNKPPPPQKKLKRSSYQIHLKIPALSRGFKFSRSKQNNSYQTCEVSALNFLLKEIPALMAF